MRALLRGLAAEGITVFLSSHLLAEIEQVATHVGVLQAGRLCFEGRLEELRGRVRPRLLLRCDDPIRAARPARAASAKASTRPMTRACLVLEPGRAKSEAQINRLLVEHGLAVSPSRSANSASLESLFFDLVIDACAGAGGMNALLARALSRRDR